MNKIKTVLISAVSLLTMVSFAEITEADQRLIDKAKAQIVEGKSKCILISNGELIDYGSKNGLSPLLTMYDTTDAALMKDGIIVDKVIGKAAASIAVLAKVRHVHGETMSEDGKEYLEKHNISTSATLMVPKILNRTRDGLCPLEASVQGIDKAEDALAAIRKKIAELMKNR